MSAVGIVGAGVMGLTTARKMIESGAAPCVFDAFAAATERARAAGCAVAESLAALAARSDVVLMFLPGPKEVRECVAGEGGLLSGARRGSVIVDMSTVDPKATLEMAPLARGKGVGYLDAPVLGRPATVGRWALPVGGEAADLAKAEPVLRLVAGKVIHVGASGRGHTVKLLNQMMFGAVNAMTAEMMAVSESVGVAPRLLFETIASSQAGTVSNLFLELGRRVAEDDYEAPTFSVELLCKDVRLGLEMAEGAGAPPLLGRVVAVMNETARAQGLGKLDTAAMWKAVKACWGK